MKKYKLSRIKNVRKGILLRTFDLYRKSIIFTVRLSFEILYERSLKHIKLCERSC